MTARPRKRSLTLRGHRTSVSLEDEFWSAFRAIARHRGEALDALAARIDEARGTDLGLASAIRLFVLRQTAAPPPPFPDDVTELTDPAERSDLVARVLAALPAWFGRPEANARYAVAAAGHVTFAAPDGSAGVAALTLADVTPDAAEIDVLGVVPEAQGQGLGTRLVAAAASRAQGDGKRLLTVRTVSGQLADPLYARTRHFYRRQGFLAAAELPAGADFPVPGTLFVKPL